MKAKIKVKILAGGFKPVVNELGDWIDLCSAIDLKVKAPQSGVLKYKVEGDEKVGYRDVYLNTYYIPLGVAIELPKGYEAIIASRSSGPKRLGMMIPNGQGIVDNSYNSDTDEWNYVMSPMKDVNIERGDRICQFRIQLSQKATMWQKIKWLFTTGVEIVEVDSLTNQPRGGLGSSGIK